jgi:hypothetical protein
MYNNKEIRGEVSAVYEKYYVLKGKNGSTIKITIDDINEHYPKNRLFDNKNVKRFSSINENNIEQDEEVKEKKPVPVEKVQKKKNKMIEEFEKEEGKNSPDNQVDLTIEKDNISLGNIKSIGKLLYYKNYKHSDIMSMFEKKLLSKEEIWYLLTERGDEIHIVKNNEKGFQIQPFVTSLVGHFLKQNGKLNEAYEQIKVKGNNSLIVLADTAEMAEEIDIERAEEAHKRAKQSMEDARLEENVDFVALQAALERSSARIKVGKKYRKLPPSIE